MSGPDAGIQRRHSPPASVHSWRETEDRSASWQEGSFLLSGKTMKKSYLFPKNLSLKGVILTNTVIEE